MDKYVCTYIQENKHCITVYVIPVNLTGIPLDKKEKSYKIKVP